MNFFSRENPKLKNLVSDIVVVCLGILTAIGIFAFLKNQEDKKETESLIPRGVEALNRKEYSKSIYLFKEAEKKFPENQDVKRYLGNLYFLKGKYDDALAYYSVVPQSDLNDYEREDLGEIYFFKNNYDSALEIWKDKEISPQSRYKLAQIYYENEAFENYYAELNKISNYQEPLVLLQQKNNDLQSVLTNLDKAISLDRLNNTETFNIQLLKSQIAEAKKQNDSSKKEYAELIQIAAYGNINQCRLLKPRIDNLKNTLASKKISTYQVDYYKGYCLNQLNNPDEAIPLIDAAIKADPSMIEYRESLAKSYFLKNDITKVSEIYNDIFKIQKNSSYYENLAIYLYKSGNLDEALKNYDLAFSIEKENDLKERYGRSILQINLINLKKLEVCKRKELIDILNKETSENYLLRGHCSLFTQNNLDGIEARDNLNYTYLTALQKKNKEEINKVIDQDVEGVITNYYKSVGELLVRS